jgi:hypothetical protein
LCDGILRDVGKEEDKTLLGGRG